MTNFATSLAIASMLVSASAFAPSTTSSGTTALQMSDASKEWPTINGWKADSTKFCAGLPGSVAPLGQFDPWELTSEMSIKEIKRYRESEVTHGRVAMLATVGYLVGESSFHPLFGGEVIGPANSHLAQVQDVAPDFFTILVSVIALAEIRRALVGWNNAESLAGISDDVNNALGASLKDSYYPGDIGFDPFGLKPKNGADFEKMATKEIQNGRLAMFGAAGMLVQEQVTHEPIMQTLQHLF